jgi:uncharacterized protein YndB with AHSA1/START domain
MKDKITVEVNVPKNIETVWECLVSPKHIVNWNFATKDWYCPEASSNLKVGGKFCYIMSKKKGKDAMEFKGIFREIEKFSKLSYQLDDGRVINIELNQKGDVTNLIEQFEAEQSNSLEIQKKGWQAILNNFKKYVEAL